MLTTSVLERPSATSSFFASGRANTFSSSLSDPTLFFILSLFLTHQQFLFCRPFYTLHLSPYPHLKCFQSFLLIPYTTLHSTQNTWLASCVVLFKGSAENNSLPVKSFFFHSMLCFTSWKQFWLLLIMHWKYLNCPLVRRIQH